MSATAPVAAFQPSFDDLGHHLSQVSFVVVDLETTGGAATDSITEIGAVKVRGGQTIGEFQTLINPCSSIPPLIAVLTGITDAMVAGSPTIEQVLPAFLEFARDSVLVAHNARFDVGFLKRACEALGYEWPRPVVVDTVALARQVLLRDEVPNCKLSTLAAYFHATTTPEHRALADARATVDVLHALIERVGNRGVSTLEDLRAYLYRVSPQRRAKAGWAKALPERPGVYSFVSDDVGERRVLYVGKSRNLRRRVATYFTASEKRPRMEEMIRIATGVEVIECVTDLEADVRELRLIASHEPRYNRRSKFPQRQLWLKITAEPFPRLSLVREVRPDDATYFGPFARRGAADEVVNALYEAFPIRQCTKRLAARGSGSACVLAELGRCASPCDGRVSGEEYGRVVEQVRDALVSDVRPVLRAARGRLARLVDEQRYEEAIGIRSRLETFCHAAVRHHRVASLAACPQLVAAERIDVGNAVAWDVHVVRFGRLAAARRALPGEVPQQIAWEAVATAETVVPPPRPAPAATIEETERIADWLERPGVRFIEMDGDWFWPLHAGLDEGGLARHALGPLALTA